MRPITVTQTGVGATTTVLLNWQNSPFAVGVGVVVSGTVTFSIEHTNDGTNWFAPAADTGKTANHAKGYTIPALGVRTNVTAGTGSVTMTVLQGASL